MDGMDGLIVQQTLTLSLTINILMSNVFMNENFQILSLILISLFLAFYKFNKPSEKFFIGDVLSIQLIFIQFCINLNFFLKNGPLMFINFFLLFF